MRITRKNAFTLMELLIAFAIVSAIFGVIITMVSRGASNVSRGSFNALSANQACWIVTMLRDDISRSIGQIDLSSYEDKTWTGESELKIVIDGGTASYSIVKRGSKKILVREFVSSNQGTAFSLSDNIKQSFGDEYMTDMSIKQNDEYNCLDVNITMKDPNKPAGGAEEYNWSSSIYMPYYNGSDEYWVPTIEN